MKTNRMLIGSALAILTLCIASAAQSPQSHTAQDFTGTWHWIFQGKPLATMVLEQKDGVITGTITNEWMNMDEQGRITDAQPRPGSSPIVRTSIENGVLRIVEKDGDNETEWSMTLTSATTGELRIAGQDAPANAEPIPLEKAQ